MLADVLYSTVVQCGGLLTTTSSLGAEANDLVDAKPPDSIHVIADGCVDYRGGQSVLGSHRERDLLRKLQTWQLGQRSSARLPAFVREALRS